jgi:hypothetical protein
MNRRPSHLKAARPCSNWRRMTVDQEASTMWWIITRKSMPMAMPVQKVRPTSQE